MNILVSPGWGPGTKVSFKGAIKQFTYSLSQVKHRIHYNEKLVKISHPARRVTETNVSRFQYFVKMEKHNRPWYYLKLISLWLSRNNETLSRERGPWLSGVRVIYQAWIQIAVPSSDQQMKPVMIWILGDLQPWLLHTMMSGTLSVHHAAASSWF